MENKYENMEINSYLEVDDVYRLIVTEMSTLAKIHTDVTHYIAVYGKCDLIRELYETLICEGYHTSFAHFAFDDEVCKDDVYIMTIDKNDEVSISDAYAPSGRVSGHDADVAIISMDDCKQDIIDYCVNTDKKVILFDFDCDEECTCCDFGTMCTCDDCCANPANESTSTSYTYDDDGYKITIKYNLDAEDALKVIENMEKRMERVNDIFKEMNEFRKLFGW